MPKSEETKADISGLVEEHLDTSTLSCWMFHNVCVYFDEALPEPDGILKGINLDIAIATNYIRFARGHVATDLNDAAITHIVAGTDGTRLKEIRQMLSQRKRIPRVVELGWVFESWRERTLVDEEIFAP
jgi:DNA ligase 4